MRKKIFITGYGAITAAGNTAQETWRSIKAGRTGIDHIKHWDSSNWDYSLGGEIKNYDAKCLFSDRKLLKLLSRQDVLGLNAAIQAVEHSCIEDWRKGLSDPEVFNEKTGIYVGSPGNKFYQQYDYLPLLAQVGDNIQSFAANLEENVHPMWLLKVLPNNVLAYTGIRYGFKGANQNITNHAVSGMQAIIEAHDAISFGLIERAIVIAYDYGIGAQDTMYYQGSGLLSKSSICSFDALRDGTIMGEGAGALVLESEDAALERGARIYGEILGGSTTTENRDFLSLNPSGSGLTNAILKLLDKIDISPEEIGMITAHANGTQASDATEAAAILQCFKYKIPVTGFKWSTGHTLCAAGVIETILTLFSLQEQLAPGIATLKQKDSIFEDMQVSSQNQPVNSNIGLLITRAFYSLNSCILIRAL